MAGPDDRRHGEERNARNQLSPLAPLSVVPLPWLDFRRFCAARSGNPSRELLAVPSFVKWIRTGLLERSQFPDALQDLQGTISRPEGWR